MLTKKRVERGLRWLKTAGPTYGLLVGRVDPEILDLGSGDLCVLAQAFTGDEALARDRWTTVLEILRNSGEDGYWSWQKTRAFVVEHGFAIPDSGFDLVRRWRHWQLTAAWRRTLREVGGHDLAE